MLIASAACYGVAFVLPAVTITDFSTYVSVKFYEFLNLFGIALLLGSIGLVVLGAQKTKKGITVKRFAWGSLIPMTLVLFPVVGFMLLNLVYYDVVSLGIGTYVILFGMILAFIGGVDSKNFTYHQAVFQQHGYKTPQSQYPQNIQNAQFQPMQGQFNDNYQHPRPQPTDNSNQVSAFCSQCGSKRDGPAKFCNNCGTEIV